MKNVFLVGAISASLFGAQAAMAEDTWSFDGSEAVIEKLVEKQKAKEASNVVFAEVYQNQMLCWSWDACVDKNRVYGRKYDTYSFE